MENGTKKVPGLFLPSGKNKPGTFFKKSRRGMQEKGRSDFLCSKIGSTPFSL